MSKIARVDTVIYSEVTMLIIWAIHAIKYDETLNAFDAFRPLLPIMFITLFLFYTLLVLPERKLKDEN